MEGQKSKDEDIKKRKNVRSILMKKNEIMKECKEEWIERTKG